MNSAAMIGALALLPIIGLYVLLVAGFPYGEFAMGGKYKVVPKEKRFIFVISIIVQVCASVVILQTAGILPLVFSALATRRICYLFAVFFSFNIFTNALSKSRKERLVMTPLSMGIAVCFWLTAIWS